MRAPSAPQKPLPATAQHLKTVSNPSQAPAMKTPKTGKCWHFPLEFGHLRPSPATIPSNGTHTIPTMSYPREWTLMRTIWSKHPIQDVVAHTNGKVTQPHSIRHRGRRTQDSRKMGKRWGLSFRYWEGTDSASDLESSGPDSESETKRGRRPIKSFGTCVGQNVGKKLHKKIIDHRYIDLSLLLPSSDESDPPANFTFELTDTHKKPSVTLSKPKAKPIETFDEWNEVWETFVAIYTSPKPYKNTSKHWSPIHRTFATWQDKIIIGLNMTSNSALKGNLPSALGPPLDMTSICCTAHMNKKCPWTIFTNIKTTPASSQQMATHYKKATASNSTQNHNAANTTTANANINAQHAMQGTRSMNPATPTNSATSTGHNKALQAHTPPHHTLSPNNAMISTQHMACWPAAPHSC